MRLIQTDQAPAPAGHYSQGVVHGDVVHVAGQLPLDPSTGALVDGGIEAQVERTLRNVEAVLVAAESGLDRVLSMTVYVTDVELWPQVNAAYARVMGEHRPARAVVPVPSLRKGCLVEIQAVGAVR
jgi:2-iminobutanoate/2-iminopropanoate deaminase